MQNNRTPASLLRQYVIGFCMGTADLIPGVSGGTIAFLSGIYEQLLEAINTVTASTIPSLLRGNIRRAIQSTPFSFLLPLLLGIGTAVFALAHLLSWLLRTHPTNVWSFFFGLVLASTIVVAKRVRGWNLQNGILFLVGTVIGYLVVGAVPVETPATIPYFFGSGAIAICAMILPGISGSFILLILGKYQQILEAVAERNIAVLVAVAAGCAVGLAIFSRILSWLFRRYHDIAVAILAGFMFGSIRKLWPWKDMLTNERNIFPAHFDASVITAIGLAIIAAVFVFLVERRHVVKDL